jgi:high-affinity Fe2+/Pb2+ permease
MGGVLISIRFVHVRDDSLVLFLFLFLVLFLFLFLVLQARTTNEYEERFSLSSAVILSHGEHGGGKGVHRAADGNLPVLATHSPGG